MGVAARGLGEAGCQCSLPDGSLDNGFMEMVATLLTRAWMPIAASARCWSRTCCRWRVIGAARARGKGATRSFRPLPSRMRSSLARFGRVEVGDAKGRTLEQAQAGAVHELCHETGYAAHWAEQEDNFVARQDNG